MKNNKTISIMMVLLLVTSFSVSIMPQVEAADETEIEDSIVLALGWLAGEQQGDGRWLYGAIPDDCVDIATTGLVLLKFVERAIELGLDPFDDGEYIYADNVNDGFDFLFDNIAPHANGYYFPCLDIYQTSCGTMPIAASKAMTKVITTGPLTGDTYEDALEGLLEYLEFAQNDDTDTFDCDVGGWGYAANHDGWSDNSNSGYVALALGYLKAAGFTISADVLAKLSTFIDNVQDASGGSIYEPCTPYAWINILKTGNLLYEMSLVGDEITDARVQAAIGYIEDHWGDTGQHPEFNPTSLGWEDSYQAMFAMMKGLVTFGITELENGAPFDWFDEVSTQIVDNQNALGYYEHINPLITEGEDSTVLRTAWALLTLEKFIPPPPFRKHYTYTDVDFNPWHYETAILLSEDFSDCPPIGWIEDPAHNLNWYCQGSNFAGGTPPEFVLDWSPQFDDLTWFQSPAFSTEGMVSVEVSYKQFVNWYQMAEPDTFFTGVQASIPGDPWSIVYFEEHGADSGPETIEFMLPAEYLDEPTVYIRFFFLGDTWDLLYWYIDDVLVTGQFIVPDPAELGTPLESIEMVINHNKVKSHNPGQFYAVISLTGPVQTFLFKDLFDEEFNVNPKKIGTGGVQVILLDPDGFAEVITDTPGVTITAIDNKDDHVDIQFNLPEPLQPGYTLMIYIKFQTAYKQKPYGGDHVFWDIGMFWDEGLTYDDPPTLTTGEVLLPITGEGVPLPP